MWFREPNCAQAAYHEFLKISCRSHTKAMVRRTCFLRRQARWYEEWQRLVYGFADQYHYDYYRWDGMIKGQEKDWTTFTTWHANKINNLIKANQLAKQSDYKQFVKQYKYDRSSFINRRKWLGKAAGNNGWYEPKSTLPVCKKDQDDGDQKGTVECPKGSKKGDERCWLKDTRTCRACEDALTCSL